MYSVSMLIMRASFLGIYFLVFYDIFKATPKTYAEAAEIDGAGDFAIMLRVYFPIAANTFLTILLISFITYWNDYQTPLLYFPSKPTLSYGLFRFTTDTAGVAGTSTPLALATCFLLMIPILIVFLFTSEKLIGNVSVGGLKE